MKSVKDIKQSIRKLKVDSSHEIHGRVLHKLLTVLDKSKNHSAVQQPIIWRIIMKSKITKFAVAAVIIIAIVAGINQLGGSIDPASVAWAAVAERVEEIQNYVFRMRQTETSGPVKGGFEFVTETEMIMYNSSQHGNKTESYRNGELITRSFLLLQEKEFIGVCPPAKMYERRSLSEAQLREMDQMSPRKIVSRFMSADYKALGPETIDGIEVEGVEVDDPKVLKENPPPLESFAARLWVDVETELPVWLELEFVPKGSTNTTKMVVDEFVWDVQFDASEFEPNIPADYSSERKRGSAAVKPKEPSVEKAVSVEAYLSEFEDMDLPDVGDLKLLGLEEDEPKMDITLVGHTEVWKTQDDFIRSWPAYAQVREQLYKELLEKLDIENLSTEELVATGLALREKFWQRGGCLSKVSYSFGYAARILLEMAHYKEPENMNITDELVESILSVELGWRYSEDSEEKIRNIHYREALPELRSAQLEQIKKEIEQGRTPGWKDFVRVNDLAILLGTAKDYKCALEVVDWLILEAERGGWTAYLSPLKRMQKRYSDGEKFYYNIYVNKKIDVFPEEYRYSRRLPSFQGPARRKRGVVPAHINDPNPFWTGD